MLRERGFNQRADELIADHHYRDARALLDAAVQEMPSGWTPKQESGEGLTMAFWDQEEFLAYCQRAAKPRTELTLWVPGSYSKAWYQLGAIAIAIEEKLLDYALFCLDCGISLEPDHPRLWNEKGYALGTLGRHEEALECYVRAASVREWAAPSQMALAWRGQGAQLIDLGRLDEAEDALRESLKWEPESETAEKELEYIDKLREKQAEEGKKREELPWYLHSFVNPPRDPLTVQLLALVEDLPLIPGPEDCGIGKLFEDLHCIP